MIDRATRFLREPVVWVPWLLALLPALWMTSFVLQGSPLPYGDYWDMVPRSVTPSGGLDLDGLFTFQNEHPVVLPQLLYWANIHLGAGSNITLGLVIVAITFLQVVLISLFVRREDRRTWAAAAIVVVASVLLFSRHGVHNFSKSMSGAAWLTANLFVIAAILARWKDRTWTSAGLGVAASLSYGTGLVVWPVLIIVGLIRDRRWLPDWRIVVVAVPSIVFWIVRRPPDNFAIRPGPRKVLENALGLGSAIFTDSLSVMRVATALAVLVGVVLTVIAIRRNVDAAAPWIGLFAYGVGCLVIISRGRFLELGDDFTPSRYASLAALLWIGLFGLATVVAHWKSFMLLPAVALVAISVSYNSPAVQEQRDFWLKQDDLAAALLLGLSDDGAYSFPLGRGPLTVGPLLEGWGNYPFGGSYDGDCGLLGTTYDQASTPVADTGRIESVRRMSGSHGIRIIARLPDDREPPIDCVVVSDADDVIVGIGTVGLGQQPTLVGMARGAEDPNRLAAIAPLGSTQYRVLLVLDDGSLVQLGAPISTADIKGL